MAKGNPNPCPAARFKPGHTGRPVGTKNQTTLLKEKILKAALGRDIDGSLKIFSKKGKCLVIPEVSTNDLIKVAATLIPREQLIKGEGFETNVTLANVLGGEEITPEVRRELIACLRKRRSEKQPLIVD